MDNANEKWVFIVNPIAGNGYGETIVPTLKEMIQKHNVDAEIVFTERSGHAPNCQNNSSKKDSDILLQLAVTELSMKLQTTYK